MIKNRYPISDATVRRLAGHLVKFPKPETSKILTSIPSEDRLRVIEEIVKIRNLKINNDPKNNT
jgi:hypothetical protein